VTGLDLDAAILIGFSMGGGEVARYFSKYGSERLYSVVFASAVTPYMPQSSDNPDGPLTKAEAAKMSASLTAGQDSFYNDFTTQFFSAGIGSW
jgi:pimeloyl-ACP methyl ester carboxylesterase